MAISKEMSWGTKIEMMPGKRSSFRNGIVYTGTFLGYCRGSDCIIKVLKDGQSAAHQWHQSFWRQKP